MGAVAVKTVIANSMKKWYALTLCVMMLFLAGCVRQNYSLQYSFDSKQLDDPIFGATDSGFEVALPLQDFTCQTESVKAVLEREDMQFRIILSGTETPRRCQTVFNAEIEGVDTGDYAVQIIYRVDGEDATILSSEFTVQ